jgi:indolepyruvate ferredoxin oxidoreductase
MAHDPAAVNALADHAIAKPIAIVRRPAIDDTIATREAFLVSYQNATWAARYTAFVQRVREAEAALGVGTSLTDAVARNLFKLMAYKDEYEVARLHTDTAFAAGIAAQFEGDYRLHHHLAPPMLARRNTRGEAVKQSFGPWVRRAFGVLARLKGLRGTPFDVFGYTAERRVERALIVDYRQRIDGLLPTLNADNLALAVRIARVPDGIRGYGHVKAQHLLKARALEASLVAEWDAARGGTPASVRTA